MGAVFNRCGAQEVDGGDACTSACVEEPHGLLYASGHHENAARCVLVRELRVRKTRCVEATAPV